jgi:hypothetical protein
MKEGRQKGSKDERIKEKNGNSKKETISDRKTELRHEDVKQEEKRTSISLPDPV